MVVLIVMFFAPAYTCSAGITVLVMQLTSDNHDSYMTMTQMIKIYNRSFLPIIQIQNGSYDKHNNKLYIPLLRYVCNITDA